MTNRRLPNNVHRLRGTKRKQRHGEHDAPLLPPDYPPMPEMVEGNPKAASHWQRIKKVMEPLNIITPADVYAMSLYCMILADFTSDPRDCPSGKIRLLRLLRGDLYLDSASREKIGGRKAIGNPFAEL